MRLKIYLVEDSQVIRDSLIEFFEESLPARVVGWTATEQQACDWLRANPDEWELAVVDLFLEKGSGLGILRALAGRSPDKKIAVLTNYATQQMREICKLHGADAVFDKSEEIEKFTQYALQAVRTDLATTRH